MRSRTPRSCFADIVGFTPIGSDMAPADLVNVLNELFGRFDELAERHGSRRSRPSATATWPSAGVPLPRSRTTPTARSGSGSTSSARPMTRPPSWTCRSELRVGIHTGPLVAGVIGRDKLAYDLWGDTVNVASRMESQGLPGRIQISETTAQRLTTQVSLEPRGTIEVRGRGPMRVLLVSEASSCGRRDRRWRGADTRSRRRPR